MIDEPFHYTVDEEGIARVTFDLTGEKINKFSLPVLEALERLIDRLTQDKSIKVLTLASGKPDVFIAGADLHSFEPIFRDPAQGKAIIAKGHQIFDRWSHLPFPTVALIEGACLGGGLEFALACTYRIVSDHPKTQLGLPEVSLGIIPGWGGTQRLIRLVGLMEGLPLILSGKPVKAMKAWKMKLADGIAAPEFFAAYAKTFVDKCMRDQDRKTLEKRKKRRSWAQVLLEGNPLGRMLIYRRAEQDILKRTKGHYPAPLIALDLIKQSYSLPLQEGLKLEQKKFNEALLKEFAIAPHLIHLFFVQEAMKKDTGGAAEIKPKEIHRAAVIGAGTMGSGIAWLFSNKEIPVRMKDVDWSALGRGFGNCYSIYSKLVKDKKLKKGEASLKFHQITGTVDDAGFNTVDIVVEAALENLELKQKIFQELEAVISPQTILASNTSSLMIGEIGKGLKHPERLVGMHFFNPANKMPLVEVIASPQTSQETIVTIVDLCRRLGKTAVVVKDCPGFLVNRIFMTGVNEIMRLYEEGASMEQLDKMMLDFGMPMSPFILADEVGNDVGYKVCKVLESAYGERMDVPKIVTAMYENHLYGKKSGQGFYLYSGHKKKINPSVQQLRLQVGLKQRAFSIDEMRERTFLAMINEAFRCLEEGVVANADYLDMALIMGIGFPPFRGGLIRYAETLGLPRVVQKLQRLEELYGKRFTPCPLLLLKAGR